MSPVRADAIKMALPVFADCAEPTDEQSASGTKRLVCQRERHERRRREDATQPEEHATTRVSERVARRFDW
jgi:hypothetical protein